jgi:hypothetical protein
MLQKAQLGRNIMQGAISLWSTVELIHQRNKMGFMVKLDFYHAYDRVCLPSGDRVPAAMGFSDMFQKVVHTLHRCSVASFLLSRITTSVPFTFSV